MNEHPLLNDIAQAVVDLLPEKTVELTRQAQAAGIAPQKILLEGLAAGMKRVGELFAAQEFFVPEVLMAARAMEAGMAMVQLPAGESTAAGRVVLSVVEGDIHDLGKNIVKVLLKAEGFQVTDLGKDVPIETIVQAVAEQQPDILGLSALMTTTMTVMPVVINRLAEAGLRSRVKVVVGGAPLTAEYARSIGADGYAADAIAAVQLAKQLLGHGT